MNDQKLRRMLDADVLRVAEVFVWEAKQIPYDEPSEHENKREHKNERDRERRALKKAFPGMDVTEMLPPKEKTGRKNLLGHLEWELTELFQYSGLDQKDSAWCAVELMRLHGLARPYQLPNVAGRTSQRPSAAPTRVGALEHRYRQAQKKIDAAQTAFLASSKARDEATTQAAFETLNKAWENYYKLGKLMAHPHVASSVKLLQLWRGQRPVIVAKLAALPQKWRSRIKKSQQ